MRTRFLLPIALVALPLAAVAAATASGASGAGLAARADLDALLDRLDERQRQQVRVTEFWNLAIWPAAGSRYPNDWNRNVMTLPAEARDVYLARSSVQRAEVIRAANTRGVPEDLATLAKDLADSYDRFGKSIAARVRGEQNAGPDAELMRRMQELDRRVEELRQKYNRQLGLNLVEVSIA